MIPTLATLSLCHLPPILADLSESTDYARIGWIVVALAACIAGANSAVDLWVKMFPKASPPNHAVYASKAELLTVEKGWEAELARQDKEHKGNVQRVEGRFEHWIEDMERKHEARTTVIEQNREERAQATERAFQAIERSLGRLEGKIDSLKPTKS